MYWSIWSLVADDSVVGKLRELLTLSGVTSHKFQLLKKRFSKSLGLFVISSRTFEGPFSIGPRPPSSCLVLCEAQGFPPTTACSSPFQKKTTNISQLININNVLHYPFHLLTSDALQFVFKTLTHVFLLYFNTAK